MRPEQERASLRLVLALAREACRRIPNSAAPFIDRLRIEVERHDAAMGRAPGVPVEAPKPCQVPENTALYSAEPASVGQTAAGCPK